ncbi:hypothetical protein HLV39_10255 [Marinobacter adhaerens]|uniref:DUF6285 domain-containing protein n=1 Tax=Marinobacter adhaerens TaxID=1033846 RepID=A0A851I127_9GAMM|nr:DUF6285 domain-containing protein [Marinobacter adhaerens]NWN91871.1 hypothetical protein [Marinobacter adhaerens]
MNHPDAPELLAVARETLMNEIFPSVPEHLRYEVRMIASAMGIAAREAKAGEHVIQEEIALLSALLPEIASTHPMTLETVRQEVADAIRAGTFDGQGGKARELQKTLEKTVVSSLKISNPKVAGIAAKQRSF